MVVASSSLNMGRLKDGNLELSRLFAAVIKLLNNSKASKKKSKRKKMKKNVKIKEKYPENLN